MDAGYITIFDNNTISIMPYKRTMTKKVFFNKYDYVYDEYHLCYIYLNNKILKYPTIR